VLGNAEVDQVVINTCKVLDAAALPTSRSPWVPHNRSLSGPDGKAGPTAVTAWQAFHCPKPRGGHRLCLPSS